MATVAQHIAATDSAICSNIATLTSQRDLLAQNVLSQLRNLVEGVAVRLHTGSGKPEHDYAAIEAALAWVRANGRLNFVTRFHTLLQPSASHYTFDGDTSERLMLRYYEYMLRLRTLLHDHAGVDILGNLESFPLDQDPALAEYHEKIAVEVDKPGRATSDRWDRNYIHKTRPFVTGGRVYYEVTSTRPSTASARPTGSSVSRASTSQTTTPRTWVSKRPPLRYSGRGCPSPSSGTGRSPSAPAS